MKSKTKNPKVRSTTTFEKTETFIDSDGVVTASKSINYKVTKDHDSFFRVYVDHIAMINRLTHSEIKFLNAIASLVDWDTNKITFGGAINDKIKELAQMGDNVRRHCVSSLAKKNILIREAHVSYMLNPKIFFRGSEIERSKVLQLQYRFEIETTDLLPEKKAESKITPNFEFEKE